MTTALTTMELWVMDEEARVQLLKNLRNVRVDGVKMTDIDALSKEGCVAYDVDISYTTYDSPRANCRDGYQYYELITIDLVKELVLENQDSNDDDYAYGYDITIKRVYRHDIELKIAELHALIS